MWRELEGELIDILRRQGAELRTNEGDIVVVDENGNIEFSLTELAKELMRRGIGQGTPR